MSYEGPDPDTGDDERKRDSSRKRDGKRDKKEKGYQVFEEEDSEEEPLAMAEDIKSPSKAAKKERVKPSFKFPVRKEKAKEKDEKKDKESKLEEKEKKKEQKERKKHKKDNKKSKHGQPDSGITISEPSHDENPIFGVPLAVAVERNRSHDGIELPALVRECIDYIEEFGLACEGIYRISGVKSKVQHLKDCYNRGQPVYLHEHEPNIIASLLKQFLRDLPEPVLTTALMPKFEEASTIKVSKKKVEAFTRLIADLPTCNRLLLSWMIVHMTHVIELAKENKMTLQNVSIVLSPTMQISHRVLNVLFSCANLLFGDVHLRKYVPPLKPAHSKWSLELPDNPAALEEELAKQESLLNQLHAELHSGKEDPEISEQLWEVQRVVTQLKRKIKMAKKNVDGGDRRRTTKDTKRSSNTSIPSLSSLSAPEELKLDLRQAPASSNTAVNETTVVAVVERTPEEREKTPDRKAKMEDTAEVEKSPEVEMPPGVHPLAGKSNIENNASSEGKESHPERKASEESNVTKKSAKEENKASETQTAKTNQIKKGVTFAKDKDAETTMAEDKIHSEKSEQLADGKEFDKEEENVMQSDGEVDTKESHDSEQGHPQDKRLEKAVANKDKEDEKETPGNLDGAKEKSHLSSRKDENETQVASQNEISGKSSESEVIKETSIDNKDKQTEKSPRELREGESKAVTETVEKSVSEKEQTGQSSGSSSEVSKVTSVPSAKMSSTEDAAASATDKASTKSFVKTKQEYVYRKAPNPPFVSTSLLKPMKAEPPKAKPVQTEDVDLAVAQENQRKSEQLRELEEELLGEKKDADDAEVDQLIEEEYALKMEEEELLAIADELRQKIATERSEMERLAQEIQELQYLRQDSDLEDLSSSSSSSEDSEDEDDLHDLLGQLIQQNEDLEMKNYEMCQKIHEERMICLSVKLQIRLLQQKQLETSYG